MNPTRVRMRVVIPRRTLASPIRRPMGARRIVGHPTLGHPTLGHPWMRMSTRPRVCPAKPGFDATKYGASASSVWTTRSVVQRTIAPLGRGSVNLDVLLRMSANLRNTVTRAAVARRPATYQTSARQGGFVRKASASSPAPSTRIAQTSTIATNLASAFWDAETTQAVVVRSASTMSAPLAAFRGSAKSTTIAMSRVGNARPVALARHACSVRPAISKAARVTR